MAQGLRSLKMPEAFGSGARFLSLLRTETEGRGQNARPVNEVYEIYLPNYGAVEVKIPVGNQKVKPKLRTPILAMFEVGRRKISEELAERLIKFYQSVETNEYLEAHFDYMRVCFPTNNHVKVIEEVLKLDYDLFVFKETKLYGYREMYYS
ncbi:hypothetical protein DZ782_11970 [Enterococcus faecium]|nr:hypothetical protein [Enterococcus faecium]